MFCGIIEWNYMKEIKDPNVTRAYIIHPILHTEEEEIENELRDHDAKLEEAVSLSGAIGVEVIHAEIINLKQANSGTFLGKGKVLELARTVRQNCIDILIINKQLSPIQHRNLESDINCKVVDRPSLIIEIFAERARTKEGMLQVKLASLQYQKSRLVRSWTHLERQRGGHGFTGGPGEKQIESDRRAINKQIKIIKEQLKKVVKTRSMQRKSRMKVPYPIVALVGYTNAGKSSLFNHLTGSNVYAEDELFATLDPTMRLVELPSKRKVILSDTVGFISDLPHELVDAFRATLEEVSSADVLVHVRDVASPDLDANREDVITTLKMLCTEETLDRNTVEVMNKIDLVNSTGLLGDLGISAKTGENCEIVLEIIDEVLAREDVKLSVNLAFEEGFKLGWIYNHARNVEVQEKEGEFVVTASMTQRDYGAWHKLEDE